MSRSVLALHGFTGTPFELGPIVEVLARGRLEVVAPHLEGHGSTADALARATWQAALRDVEAAFERLPRPAPVIGMSMGGALALRLAARRPDDVSALVLLATPIRFDARIVRAVRALAALPRPLRRGVLAAIPKLGGSDVSDPAMRRENPSLGAFPVPALASYFDLVAEIGDDLPKVRAPALIVHARQDHTVPFENGAELAERIGSPVVETLWLDRSFHLVGLDVERERVAETIFDFLRRHASSRMGAP